jgi:hypothetical protein
MSQQRPWVLILVKYVQCLKTYYLSFHDQKGNCYSMVFTNWIFIYLFLQCRGSDPGPYSKQVLYHWAASPALQTALLIALFLLSSSPGTWDKSCNVPPSTRQTTWPLLNSVTWTQPQPSAVTTSLSVEGEKHRFKSTCTWKQQALWSNSKGHNFLGFFFF